MTRGPTYFPDLLKANGEPVKAGSRFPSIDPEHKGQYVGRREHQKEIGQPLGWKHTEAISSKGVTRTQWQRGSMEHPVTPREVLTMLEGTVKQARSRLSGVDQVLFLVQAHLTDGKIQFIGGIYGRESLINRMRELIARKESLLDWAIEESQRLRWHYGPDAIGAVQLMVW